MQDTDSLNAMPAPRESAAETLRAIADRDPDHVLALVSGGNDSTTMLEVAAQSSTIDVDAVVHVNTGIGLEATREHVREECARHGLPYIEGRNKRDGEQYGALVLMHGFPGQYAHTYMYRSLKERVFDRLYSGFSGDLVYLSGARIHESERRALTVPRDRIQESSRKPRLTWASPIADWTGSEVREYRREEGTPDNDVAEVLDMSGECACNAYGTFYDLGYIYALDVNLFLAIWNLMLMAAEKFRNDPEEPPIYRAIYGWQGLPRGVLADMIEPDLTTLERQEEERKDTAVDKRAEAAEEDPGQFSLTSACSSCEYQAEARDTSTYEPPTDGPACEDREVNNG